MANPFDFEFAGASVVGQDHMSRNGVLIGKPNQDAMCDVHLFPEHRVFVVCDGCGSGTFSEVGSRIGARMTCLTISEMLAGRGYDIGDWPLGRDGVQRMSSFMDRIRGSIAGRIETQAKAMSDWRDSSSYLTTLGEYFSFTILGVIMAGRMAVTFNIGDGYFVVNGDVSQREAGDDNAPPYIIYDLIPDAHLKDPRGVRLRNQMVFECHDLKSIDSIIVATDGMRDILSKEGVEYPGRTDKAIPPPSGFLKDEFFINPSRLQRELSMMNTERMLLTDDGNLQRHPGLLSDDTTMYVIRKKTKKE